ncbi:hypothetical protein AWENTII_007339 [Aspergillus wentii]
MGLSMDKFRSILESPGTDLYARNYIGETALHTCVQNGNRNLVEEMMTVLLDSDEGNLAQIATYGGKTALDFALERGREESIELLVQPKRKATVGVEGNPDSTWITRWSDETWYSHLVRILHSCQPTIAAETKRLEAKWGTPLIGWNSTQRKYWGWDSDTSAHVSVHISSTAIASPVRRIIFTMASHDQGKPTPHKQLT